LYVNLPTVRSLNDPNLISSIIFDYSIIQKALGFFP
jgi:hypothetical protein